MQQNIPNKINGKYVKRHLEDKILQYKDKPEIIAVTGPRQSGKTTLLLKIHQKLENSHFISFEDREILNLFEEDEKSFVEQHLIGYDYLIIDEFQYAEKGGKKLKYIYDHHPNKKIFITGSSALEMTVKGLRFLTGRIINFTLFPFSFEEFLRYEDSKLYMSYQRVSKELVQSLKSNKALTISETLLKKIEDYRKHYMIYGGYPRVVTSDSDTERKEILKNIVNTYLLKEIRDILDITDDRNVRNLIKLLSLQIGDPMSYDSLANKTGYSYTKLKEKLAILEQTYIIKLITPFFTNKQKEIVKAPKTYFYDNGFRNAIINNFQKVEDRNDRGELNENFFFSQAAQKELEVKYWRSKGKAEVDFVKEHPNLLAFEIKTSPRKTSSMRSFIDKYTPKNFFLMNEKKLKREQNIIYIPLVFSSKITEKFV